MACDIKPEPFVAGRKRHAHILEARCWQRIGQHQHRARAIGGDFGIEGERAIVRLPPAPRQRRAHAIAARNQLAIKLRVEPGGGDRHFAQDYRFACPHAQRAVKSNLLARQIDDGGIANRGQHARQIGAQAPRHSGAELGEDLGIGGDIARAINLEAARGYRPRQRIGSGGHIAAQRQHRFKPGEGDPGIIGIKPLARKIIGQSAAQPPFDQSRIGQRNACRHPLSRHRQRH